MHVTIGLKVFYEGTQPELCVKRAEGLSAARSGATNKTNIQKWFSEYKELVEKLNISDSPSHI